MMRSLLLVVVVVLSASTAFAQVGSIGIFMDRYGLECNLGDIATGIPPVTSGTSDGSDNASGWTTYYIVHCNTEGATSCRFTAIKPACLSAELLGESSPFSGVTGKSQTSVHIPYGSCKVGTFHVYTLYFSTMGQTAPCCPYVVTLAEITDCASPTPNELAATGLTGVVNSNSSCNCVGPIGRAPTTWGSIKELYTE